MLTPDGHHFAKLPTLAQAAQDVPLVRPGLPTASVGSPLQRSLPSAATVPSARASPAW